MSQQSSHPADDHELHNPARFAPPEPLSTGANVAADVYAVAAADPVAFWEQQARRLSWTREWDTGLSWDVPNVQWFAGGELNVAYNCVDRHVEAGHGERVAIHWEGEPGDSRTVTYSQLQEHVARAANVLASFGVGRGDRVAIYLPMIPEAVVAMLACARLGAPHSVIFGGFSAQALFERIDDAGAKVVITADGGYRRGAVFALKPAVDEALTRGATSVTDVLVVRRGGNDIDWDESRDTWWHEALATASPKHTAQPMPAENPLFILYTSGTTGRPKGILHTSGGYLTQVAYTHWAVFDLKAETDVYWCAADVGWITGHSYIVYGPLANGATSVMYEGTPDTPHQGRWWSIVEKYGVSVLYCAPTAIRTFMKWGEQLPAAHDLSTLRLLGSVGEPLNPEAWLWYHRVIGAGQAPVVDTWWQTETGAMMIAPLPGVAHCKPGSAMTSLPGISASVVDDDGAPVAPGDSGLLVLTAPWPAMTRGIWGDPDRYRETYWSRFADRGYYFAGDGARLDDDGDLWLLGRVDDVMNVAGHRISTAEVESALVSHPDVAEAAVVGASDPTTGQSVVAFVILRATAAAATARRSTVELTLELREHVRVQIGAIAKPRQLVIVPELPKTRSGKIMRRLLRDLAEQRAVGDITTLTDPAIIDRIDVALNGTGARTT